jgi:hypothetical protein
MLHMLLEGSSGRQADPGEQRADSGWHFQSPEHGIRSQHFSFRQGMLEAARGRFDWPGYRPGQRQAPKAGTTPTSHCHRLVAVKCSASWVRDISHADSRCRCRGPTAVVPKPKRLPSPDLAAPPCLYPQAC